MAFKWGRALIAGVYAEIPFTAALPLRITKANLIKITSAGTVTSATIGPETIGRKVVLLAGAAITLTPGASLSLAGSFTMLSGDTITLVSDGTTWHELCRSAGAAPNSVATVAAAAAFPALATEATTFLVTAGTGAITSITTSASIAGRVITLKFAAACTFTAGNNLKLAGGANFAADADDCIQLVTDGTNWYEISRSANA